VMPITENNGRLVWKRRTPRESLAVWVAGLFVLTLFFVSWRVISGNTLWVFVQDAPLQAGRMLSRMVPPRLAYTARLWRPLWDTLLTATFGAVGAVIIAIPVGFLAARNTSPAGGILRPFAILIIVATRSVNSLAWALLLVTFVGPGVFAGIIAISMRSVGFLGKLLYEAIEEIDQKQVDAVIATGAQPLQVLRIGILPQIMPTLIGVTVYRWDINIRESTVLGLVGAGGIGLQLQASINVLAWRQVSVVLILILITVVLSEWISARVRKAVL
jgi:phosphonate transport system permease protein